MSTFNSTTPSTGTQVSPSVPPCLKSALKWLDAGYWPVIIAPITDTGTNPGKRPIGGHGWGANYPTVSGLTMLYNVCPTAGLGLLLGDPRRVDTATGELTGLVERWLVDVEVDDHEAAAPILARMFPDGMPATLAWDSNRGGHWLFRGDERLAKYATTRITGELRDGKPYGNQAYLGVEIRIGTYDPRRPAMLQSVIPPSLKNDGTPRVWADPKAKLLVLPDSVLADLDKHATPEAKPARAKRPPKPTPQTDPTDPTRPTRPTDRPERAHGRNGAARHEANGHTAEPTPAPSSRRNGKATGAANGHAGSGKPRSWDRDAVQDAITSNEDNLLELLGELGVRLTGVLTTEGWLECHAVGRDDKEPSAGISQNGVYHDLGTDEKLPLFDLCVACKPEEYPTWRVACNKLGERYCKPAATSTAGSPTARDTLAELATEGKDNDPRRIANAVLLELTPPEWNGVSLVAHYASNYWEWVGRDAGGPVWRESPDWDAEELVMAANAEADKAYVRAMAAHAQAKAAGERTAPPARVNVAAFLGQIRANIRPLVRVGKGKKDRRPFFIAATTSDPSPSNVVACANGLLDLTDPATPKLMDTTPRYFTPCVLPFAYDANAPRPSLFLDTLVAYQWADDEDAVGLLQEWFGYCITPDTSKQKMLLLHGEPGTGKGIIAWMLRALLGRENTAEVDGQMLANDHGKAVLPGKLLATFSDSRTADSSDNTNMLQFLLRVVGGDPIHINPKYAQPYDTELLCRVMMVCNELPNLRDATGGMDRRYLVLHTPRAVPDAERDDTLRDRMLCELPGILNWAIEGRARLMARGKFVQCASGKPLLEQATEDANHVIGFIQEMCVFGGWVSAADLFDAYRSWAADREGIRTPFTQTAFGRRVLLAVKNLGGEVERSRPPDPADRKGYLPTRYNGLELRTPPRKP